jgi:hypothetical protein
MNKRSVLLYGGVAAVLLMGLAVLHYLSVDGLHGRLLNLCLITDTEYAKGYTDGRFREISVGDTREKALAVLGEPLIKGGSPQKGEWWNYSRSPGSTHYLYRGLRIRDGVVVEKLQHFYWD